MTHDAHMDRDTRPSLIGLVLAPLVLLCVWFRRFAEWTTTLKRARKAQLARCNPAEHWPGLRQSEWLMEQIRAEGVRRILAGEDLDLDAIGGVFDPPEDYGVCPRNAWAMHLRFIALAAFHADPEAVIRRHAARIVAREGARDLLGNIIAPSAAAPCCVGDDRAPATIAININTNPDSCARIRAPP